MDTNALNELSTGQKVAGGAAAVAMIASFLPWYVLGDEFFGYSAKGISFTFGWMGLVLLLAAAGLVIAPAFGKGLGNDGVAGEQIAIGIAGLGALMWAFRFLQTPGGSLLGLGRGFGLFVAVAAAAGVVAGVVMTMKEKGIAMPNVDNFKAISGGMSTTADVRTGQSDTVEF